ncbi:MAG: DUF1343 domain-containing protein [Thermodesulfobacteriota bacterium]|nr:DUF1343 domain-containing protein [Thermodesulfobacteriota bacterium]
MKPVQTGIETLLADPPPMVRGKRLGLLANAASVAKDLQPSWGLLQDHFPGQLSVLFSPQHGFYAEKQDNMVPSEDWTHPLLKIPVYSLYGQRTAPTGPMLEQIDTLIIDLQDVGTRVYTFIYTMALCLQAAGAHGTQVVVLDRPNPLGGRRLEGNSLKPALVSFVGMYPIPMRHGLTMGELAQLFVGHFGIACDVTVVPMSGWRRDMLFHDTGLPWVAPSPNLPTSTSALVYPGQVLWEGTNVSEGRGTTQPFEVFGAPFVNTAAVQDHLLGQNLAGVCLRPLVFEPTSNKWTDELCHGFQLHILDPAAYRPYRTTLSILQAVVSLYPDQFQWKRPPYEYELEKMPFDMITGDPGIRQAMVDAMPVTDLEKTWQDDLEEFKDMRKAYLLYG